MKSFLLQKKYFKKWPSNFSLKLKTHYGITLLKILYLLFNLEAILSISQMAYNCHLKLRQFFIIH
jgi:hypothetical protein